MWLYHITYDGRLESIARIGLSPHASGALGRGAGYQTHSEGGLFLTECDGIMFWYDRAEQHAFDMSDDPMEDGLTPVVIRVDAEGLDLEYDDVGSRDASADAWIVRESIDLEDLSVWNGSEWIDVEDSWTIDVEQAYDEDGVLKFRSPLQFDDCED